MSQELMSSAGHPVKIAYLAQQQIVAILNWCRAPAGSFITIDGEGVPPDVEVLNCWFCPERRAWGVMLRHPSFPLVAPNAIPPLVNPESTKFVVRKRPRLHTEN